MFKKIILIFYIIFLPIGGFCAELISDTHEILEAEVIDIKEEYKDKIPGTERIALFQKLIIKIRSGSLDGKEMEIPNDYIKLEEGQKIFVNHVIDGESGKELWSVADPVRIFPIIFFSSLFLISVFIFGGKQGIRGLLSLVGSIFLILYVLLPSILSGFSPLIASILVSSVIIILGSYVTHGFNKTTSSAIIGMIVTVIVTSFLAFYAVSSSFLYGFENEEAVYLNFNTNGSIDFQGLLLGGIIIGLLGVLYDVAIGQAISVEELYRTGPHLSKQTIFRRAIRMGKEHIGALVNTLAIAYVGASLPLLLLFYSSSLPTKMLINREIFATEIIRTMIGSIGLVLAVPVTTFIAVFMLESFRNKPHKEQEDRVFHRH